MAKLFSDFGLAVSLFECSKTKKGGISYTVGQRFSIPEITCDDDLKKILGFEVVQGRQVPCLILEQGVLFLSSLTKRVYTYTCDGSSDIDDSDVTGVFTCTGFVEDSFSDVFKLVSSCANQFDAVQSLSGKTVEVDSIDIVVSSVGDFVDENGRTKYVPTKLVEKQLPHWKFV